MMKQLFFSDMELSINRSKKTRSEIQLNKINRIVNWQDIARLLSETDKTGKQGGRKPISVLVKAKMLFVQYLYNLSDPELSEGMPVARDKEKKQEAIYRSMQSRTPLCLHEREVKLPDGRSQEPAS